MIEIKFKAKEKDGTRWIHGYYVKHFDTTPCMFSSDSEREQWIKENLHHYIAYDGFSDWWMPRKIEAVEIDINTLCQFIGRLDIDHNEIYTGDILECVRPESGIHTPTSYLMIDETTFALVVHTLDGNIISLGECWRPGDFKIIGSIYDKKE